MQGLLWLLLPAAAASGWWLAWQCRGSSDSHRKISKNFSADYFQGLNFLLNEQPDKAIEVFSRMLDVDSETVETHLALGNLFRRRGEVARAISMHENLISRPGISEAQRHEAQLELGRDYLKAGLLDRAESLFRELQGDDQALRLLCDVYQQEREWQKAIQAAEKLVAQGDAAFGSIIAHYYCELAELSRSAQNLNAASQHVQQAYQHDPRCVRASMLEGNLFAAQSQHQAAIDAYQRVSEQDAIYLSEVIEPMLECYIQLGRSEEMMSYLQKLTPEIGGIKAILLLSELIRQAQGDQRALEFLAQSLRRRPSLAGLARLIELHLVNTAAEIRDTLRVIKLTIDKLLEKNSHYRCHVCGFSGKSLYWLCPGCKTWAGIKPVQSVTGE